MKTLQKVCLAAVAAVTIVMTNGCVHVDRTAPATTSTTTRETTVTPIGSASSTTTTTY